ncbi:MAG: hypothetical protein V4650_08615 [Pseudomonadota bacterium]
MNAPVRALAHRDLGTDVLPCKADAPLVDAATAARQASRAVAFSHMDARLLAGIAERLHRRDKVEP